MAEDISGNNGNIAFPAVEEQDAVSARKLWVELATRITTQRLSFRSGNEETAAESIYSLFKLVRQLLAERGPAEAFSFSAVFLLNRVLRPYTARWHGWMVEGHFRSEGTRRQFRKELSALRRRLEPFQQLFLALSRTEQPSVELLERCFGKLANAMIVMPQESTSGLAEMGRPVLAGIGAQVPIFTPNEDKAASFVTAGEINRAEHAAVRERRAAMGRDTAAEREDELTNATGLCLSGGGIRSATFCLGIVQVLAERGILSQLDYLSTVSGGGYLGTFLSSYLGTAPETLQSRLDEQAVFKRKKVSAVQETPGAAAKPPQEAGTERAAAVPSPAGAYDPAHQIKEAFAPRAGGEESLAVRHLRNNSRYLLNGGLWARLRIVGLLVSGVFTNVLIFVPLLLAAVLAVYGLERAHYWGAPEGVFSPWFYPAPKLPLDTFAAGALGAAAGVLLVAWLALAAVQNLTHRAPPGSRGARLLTVWTSATLLLALLTVAAAGLFLLPAVFGMYVHLRRLAVGAQAVAGREMVLGALAVAGTFVLGPLAARLDPGRTKKVVATLFAISGPVLLLFFFLFVGSRVLLPDVAAWNWKTLAWIAAGLLAWSRLFLNVNAYGLHRFYRDRLCECYLVTRDRTIDHRGFLGRLVRFWVHGRHPSERDLGTLQRLPLSALGSVTAAPYHLLNTAVNLPASQNPNLRGRDCDFFVFSRHFCGSPICGYVRTAEIEKLDPHFDLGTAMAVSGAAVSSNMGALTMRNYRFLITLANVRLGYWLRNPRHPFRGRLSSIFGAPGPRYLLSEVTGLMHERRDYLNLSDGGHIENLGFYELLRRRCKYVVVVDAGHEPGMEGADLMLIQRYAAIDLGIEMQFDLSDLMLDAKRTSRAYAVMGKIFYEPGKGEQGDLGWLIYMKLAIVGGEPGYVADYRRQFPEFPHQSTGEQIYKEAQFEAYRALGEAAAASLFDDELTEPFRAARANQDGVTAGAVEIQSIDHWFQALATSLLPDNDTAFKPLDLDQDDE